MSDTKESDADDAQHVVANPKRRSMWQSGRRRISLLMLIAVSTGLILRTTIRDSVPFLATLYYATPLPVAALTLLLASVIYPAPRRFMSRICKAASVVCLIAFVTFHVHESEDELPTYRQAAAPELMRVAYWNVARGLRGWPPVFEELTTYNADVIGLVEYDLSGTASETLLRKRFPDHHFHQFGEEILLLSRYPITTPQLSGIDGTNFAEVILKTPDGDIRLVAADFKSSPLRSRKSAFDKLSELIVDNRQPTIVMGDFNTPVESVYFDSFRKSMINVARDCEFDCTWPVPFPVMTIDLMWVSPELTVAGKRLGWTWVSDHRPIVADLRIQK